MTEATVVFLCNEKGEICLARKKQPIHTSQTELSYSLEMWNGYGGKREIADLSIKETAIRELYDESLVLAVKDDLVFCGNVRFFLKEERADTLFMNVYFYVLHNYKGVPQESDEMGAPQFFAREAIPYDEMMPADKMLLPRMFLGECVNAKVILCGKEKEPLVIFED